MPDRPQKRDWVREVPDHYRPRGPYRDYGWENRESALPEWRDPSVHRMPYERGRPYSGERRGMPYGSHQRARGPCSEPLPEYYSGRYGDLDYGEPGRGYTRSRWDQGPYSGRGPQGYQRSDERIQEDVCDRLTQHGHLDASGIEVRVQDGEVTLQGTVPSRQARYMAEDTADSVPGVKDVQNRLQVQEQ
ncbi:MAG: BON domain-containing protein [Ardenticatenaceae bacterium]|nr:BON domain-containing protein [Ardenticatenaceae bacterium]